MMIKALEKKVIKVDYRTNKRVRWQYADYAGRFETIESAIKEIKRRIPGRSFQYKAWNMETDEEFIGNVNA